MQFNQLSNFFKHFAPERVLWLSAGIISPADGYVSGSHLDDSPEFFAFRIVISIGSFIMLARTFSRRAKPDVIRTVAQGTMMAVLLHLAYLNIAYNFRFDHALAYLVVFVVGGIFFSGGRAMVVYLGTGLLAGIGAYALAIEPELSAEVFLTRLVIAFVCSLAVSQMLKAQQNSIREHNKALQQANSTLRNLGIVAEKNRIGAVITDANHKISWANEGFCSLFGYTLAEVKGRALVGDILQPAEGEWTGMIPERVDKECRAIDKHGKSAWVSVNLTAVFNDQLLPDGHIGLIQDISTRKTAELESRESAQRFRKLFQQSAVAIVVQSLEDNTILDANNAACELYGLTERELVGKDIFETIPEEYRAMVRSNHEKYREIDSTVLESYALHSNGQSVPVSINISTVNYFDKPANLLFLSDITPQLETRKQLAESEEKYRTLVERSRAIILTHDLDGRVTSINKEGARSIGFTAEEATGMSLQEFIAPKYRERFEEEYLNQILSKGTANGIMSVQHQNGELRYWLYRNVMHGIGTGNPRVIGYGQDVTEQVLAEKEVRQAKKLAEELLAKQKYQQETIERKNRELDQFAYVVSHDLKAPLRGINTLTTFLEEDLGDQLTGESREHMSLIHKRVTRMEMLINGILEYSRTDHLMREQELVDLNKLIIEVIDLIAPPKQFTIEVQPILPTLMGNPVALQQVFQNLLTNAIKYNDKDKGHAAVQCRPNGNMYDFIITDNGPGIDADFHDRIFGIFQTLETKDKVESTGIGLTIVKKIVEHYGGTITLESEPGKGAAFCFSWPIPSVILSETDGK